MSPWGRELGPHACVRLVLPVCEDPLTKGAELSGPFSVPWSVRGPVPPRGALEIVVTEVAAACPRRLSDDFRVCKVGFAVPSPELDAVAVRVGWA